MLHNETPDSTPSPQAEDADTAVVHTHFDDTSTPPYSNSPAFSSLSGPSTPSIRPIDSTDDLDLLTLNEDLHGPDHEYDPEIWKTYEDPSSDGRFFINDPLLKKGLVVFSDHPEGISENKFPFGDREFSFIAYSERQAQSKYRSKVTSSARIVAQLKIFSQRTDTKTLEFRNTLHAATGLPQKVTGIVAEYANESAQNQNPDVIITKGRSDEIFFPFNFPDQVKARQTGLYTYAWPSLSSTGVKEKEEFINSFEGFDTVFTGSCLFGSTLQGVDEDDNRISLIKANLRLHPEQVITKIHYETTLQLHEIIQLQELEKQISLASQLMKEEKSGPTNFFYHLPGYDYLLVGAELYLKGNMTKPAFEEFCYIVLKRQATYAGLIEKIGKKYAFPITIVNPFQLIFDSLPTVDFSNRSQKQEAQKALGEGVLRILQIKSLEESTDTRYSDKKIEQRTRQEVCVVWNCISLFKDKLTTDPNNPLAIVWNDFIQNVAGGHIDSLKALGHIGNTVMFGVVAFNRKPYSVCALHPVSEKYIFIQYGKYIGLEAKKNDAAWKQKYPVVMCVTLMDSVHAHSKLVKQNIGQTFYFNRRTGHLFNKRGVLTPSLKILEQAGENVSKCALEPSTSNNSKPSPKK